MAADPVRLPRPAVGAPSLPGYELGEVRNATGSSYEALFRGPARANGIPGLTTMFTPLAGVTAGALGASGEWRGGAHRPMRARAPELRSGTGSFTIDTIGEPTLQSPDQTAAGGDVYTRYDLRWSVAGTHSWTTVSDVAPSEVIGSVPSGSVDVQTRCVNTAGEGLWSRVTRVSVD